MKKTVTVLGYEFDSLPAHVKIMGRGSGSNIRVACQRAIADMFSRHQLRHKRLHSFKLSFAVYDETDEKPIAGVLERKNGNGGAS